MHASFLQSGKQDRLACQKTAGFPLHRLPMLYLSRNLIMQNSIDHEMSLSVVLLCSSIMQFKVYKTVTYQKHNIIFAKIMFVLLTQTWDGGCGSKHNVIVIQKFE